MAFHGAAFAIPHFDFFLGGHDHVENLVLHAHRFNALFEVVAHLVFVTGIAMNHIPGRSLGDRSGIFSRGRGFLANRLGFA